MKTKWLEKKMKYDGTQLHSLFGYMKHKISGDSCIAWQGACDISFEHMVDGEDVLAESEIRGSDMVHFIIEIFDRSLFSAVLLQRLFTNIVRETLQNMTKNKYLIFREGDDLYWEKKKLSISIATKSQVSVLIHFAVNVSNKGTPVPTACLSDFKVAPQKFAQAAMNRLRAELESVKFATVKVRSVR